MTNQIPPNSPSPRDERQDELIAAIVALGAIGTVFFWGLHRGGDGSKIVDTNNLSSIVATSDSDDNDSSTNRLVQNPEGGSLLDGVLGGPLGGDDADDHSIGSNLGADRPNVDRDRDLSSSPDYGWVSTPGDTGETATSGQGSGSTDADSGDTVAGGTPEDASASGTGEESDTDIASGEESDTDGTTAPANEEATDASDVVDGSADEESPEAEAIADAGTGTDETEEDIPELSEEVPAQQFSDVEVGYWANPFIEGLRSQNVATGFIDGRFEPDTPISRSQFAAQIYRAFSQGGRARELDYSDVSTNHPQYEAIGQVTKSGFMSGYPEGDFRPNNNVSKLEVLLALASGLNLSVPRDPEGLLQVYYKDVNDIPSWAVPKMAAATQAGMVVNYDTLTVFDPSKPATRAEAAAMLYQALVRDGKAPEVTSEYIVQPQ